MTTNITNSIHNTPGTSSRITLQELQTKPWRYVGYKGFSEWTASDNDFFILRRFDKLAARVTHLLQWEVTRQETKLAEMDIKRSYQAVTDLHNGSFDLDDDERQNCIKSSHIKLKEYYDFINNYASLKSKPGATAENITNVQNWLKTYAGAIDPKESAFVDGHGDLFAIAAIPRSPLRRWLEKFRWFRWNRLFQRVPEQFKNDPTSHFDPTTTVYHSDKRIDSFVNVVICVAGFLMLTTPLWILFYVSSRQSQLAVITVFIAAFLSIMQSVTVAKPFESLAATAAYSAVLMVFMQIGPRGVADN